MDPRTVELLRALQGNEQDAATFERISTMFGEERVALREVDDLGMLSHLGELLEGWAEGADPELGAKALTLAAQSAEQDLEQPARAIKLLERVLDTEPSAEALEQLADLYMKRGGTNDAQQAADLYAALGDTLGGEEGVPYLKRAIALVPAHEASIELSRLYATEGKYRDALVCISPLAERGNPDAVRMHEAYLVNLEGAVPAKKSKRGESLPPPQVQRPARSGGTMVGFRLDQYHEALRQEGAEVSADSDPPPGEEDSVVRAMPQKPEAELSAPTPAPAAAPAQKPASNASKTMLGLGLSALSPAAIAAAKAAAPAAASAPAATASPATAPAARPQDPATKLGLGSPLGKSDASKTMMGVGIPASLAQSVAAAAAPFSSPGTLEAAPAAPSAPSAAAPSQVDASKTMMGIGIPAGLLPGAPAAPAAPVVVEHGGEPSEPAPVVRKSLPPPNPDLVRSSRPAQRSSRSSGMRGGAAPALSSPSRVSAPSVASAPRALFQVAPAATMPSASAEAAVAPVPVVSEPVLAAQPEAFAPNSELEPFTVSATPRGDSFAPPKRALPIKWIAGGVAALVLIGGAFAMMGGDDEPTAGASAEADSRVSQQLTTGAPAVATPPAAPIVAPAAPTEVAPTTALPGATAPAAAVPAAAEPAVAAPTPEPVAAKRASKPKGKIKVAPKEIRVRGGKITGTQIMVALEDALPKIERCYSDALEDKPKLSGKLTLGFSIQKTGKLAGAKVAKSTLKNKPLESCAVNALDGQRFPKVKKIANVTMPIGLTP